MKSKFLKPSVLYQNATFPATLRIFVPKKSGQIALEKKNVIRYNTPPFARKHGEPRPVVAGFRGFSLQRGKVKEFHRVI